MRLWKNKTVSESIRARGYLEDDPIHFSYFIHKEKEAQRRENGLTNVQQLVLDFGTLAQSFFYYMAQPLYE